MARLISARGFALYVVFALAACTANGNAETENSQGNSVASNTQSGLEETSLTIKSGDKVHNFTVEIARSKAEQNKGMMFRKEVADDRGMIFPYKIPQMLGFWMKNTLIPLDIIFIRQDGTIESIAANAEPLSLETESSGEPVALVLEIRGGLAAELGIKAGDTVSWEDSAAK